MSIKGSPTNHYHQDNSNLVPSPGQVALSVTVATTPPQAATPGPPPMTPPTSGMGPVVGGPPPMQDPNPAPPRISAAELALLTEAAATKNGTFQCTLCQKQFGYKNGLIRHVRLTHVGEKPYQCNICQRRFGYKHILMEHQNLHFGNRPYACNMCDKKFAARSNLIQHRMVHKRPFNCTMCNKRFDREDQLKKHLFAHPQSLLTCNTCKYAATSQTDLNKHMMEKHQPESQQQLAAAARAAVMAAAAVAQAQAGQHPPSSTPTNGTPPGSGSGSGLPPAASPHYDSGGSADSVRYMNMMNGMRVSIPNHPGSERGSPENGAMVPRQTEAITPPDGGGGGGGGGGAQESLAAQGSGGSLSPGSHISPGARQTSLLDASGRGQRIDAICHQLSASVAPPPGFVNPYHGVIVKQEAMEEDMHDRPHYPSSGGGGGGGGGGGDLNGLPPLSSMLQYTSAGLPHSHPSQYIYSSLTSSVAGSLNSLVPPPIPSIPAIAALSPDEKQPLGTALPGIHEVFSRRAQKLPPFGNFSMPTLFSAAAAASADNRGMPLSMPPELTLSMMSPPPSAASFPVANSGVVNPTQRPTAQLPPIAQVLRHTKDQAVQHSAPIPGFPSLDDVLSYYMSQGKLFKCQHCNILFFERGMYFLHASLHGPSNPWECSICHKICSDKNEFTLHFVNQQHNS